MNWRPELMKDFLRLIVDNPGSRVSDLLMTYEFEEIEKFLTLNPPKGGK